MNRRALIALLLIVLQVFCVVWGKDFWTASFNPWVLLFSYVGLLYCYSQSILHSEFSSLQFKNKKPIKTISLWLLSALLLGFLLPQVSRVYDAFPLLDIINHSDVMPLIIKQYDYFMAGQSPYQPIGFPSHTAYPAYLPLHWLPVGLARVGYMDPRWGGIFLLFFVIALTIVWTQPHKRFHGLSILLVLLPILLLFLLLKYAASDFAITFETVIAAYYLLLALALLRRSLVLVAVGILLCLLSRYTLVFWMPFFFLMLLRGVGLRKTIYLGSFLLLAVVLIFVLPFLRENPTLLQDSLRYHNEAVINDWRGEKWSFIWGVFFGPQFDALVAGTAEHKVMVARLVQFSAVLLLQLAALLYYYKHNTRLNFYDVALGMLLATLVCYYMIGPFAFRYYMMGPLFMSLVLWVRIALGQPKSDQALEQA